MVSIEDFKKLELKVAEIREVSEHPVRKVKPGSAVR